MMDFIKEKELLNKGFKLIAGIDEAGRGPLAGPVVAACVVFDPELINNPEGLKILEMVKDSKKMTAKRREAAFPIIKKHALAVGIGTCSHGVIDQINILQASLLACKKAVEQLAHQPDYILIDGKFSIPKFNIRQEAIIGGDDKILSIAAASIIAKVTRDYLMAQANIDYPGYGFGQHKGYSTKLHTDKIKELGPCPIHRMSFAPLKNKKNKC